MRIGVPKETVPGERRVALTPGVSERLVQKGHEVVVETGAGEGSYFPDADYESAGAKIGDPYDAEVVVKVRGPSAAEEERLAEGTVLVGLLQPLSEPEAIERLARRGVTAFALEVVPRITRAQPMDALSSQATIAGYKAVLLAAERLP